MSTQKTKKSHTEEVKGLLMESSYLSPNGELIIREGPASPIREPKIINITGAIGSPAEWYAKRKKQIDPLKCHVLFSLEKMFIALSVDDKDYFGTIITGK